MKNYLISFLMLSMLLMSCQTHYEMDFIIKVSKIEMPNKYQIVEYFDNAEFIMGAVIKLDKKDVPIFLLKNNFKPIKKEGSIYFYGMTYLDKKNLNFPNKHELLEYKGCNNTNSWYFLFDQKEGILWCEMNYPDIGGTPPPCSDFIEMEEPVFSYIYTLNKYMNSDSIVAFDYYWNYSTNLNDLNIGLFEIADTMSLLFQEIEHSWVLTDTLDYPFLSFEKIDINGDELIDLIMTHFVTGSGGNSENICFLYDPINKKLKRNRFFDLPNIKYDSGKKLVYSAWWSGASNPQTKMAFKVDGDSLIQIKEVLFEPDGVVEFYDFDNRNKYLMKKITNDHEKAFAIFTKALWDSTDE